MKQETFLYCIARPWEKTKPITDVGNMCIYTYGSQVHQGTMLNANSLLEYVLRVCEICENDENDYVIVRLNPEVITTKRKPKNNKNEHRQGN